jgi:AcrR family transcriptional regulator
MSVQERRDRDREHRKQAILDAAERVYFSKGVDATMDDIASAAEIAKGTLYLYFPSKDDLWLSLIVRALASLEGRFREAVDPEDAPPVTIRRIGEAYVRYAQEHANMFRLLLDSAHIVAHSSASLVSLGELAHASDSLWTVFTDTLQKGIDRGIFRSDINAFEMAIIFWSNTTGLLRQMGVARGSEMRRREGAAYSFERLDFLRLVAVSNELLLQSLLVKDPPASPIVS